MLCNGEPSNNQEPAALKSSTHGGLWSGTDLARAFGVSPPAFLTAKRRSGIIFWGCTGAWPSGKAPGFGPGIAGSNPAAPARRRERSYPKETLRAHVPRRNPAADLRHGPCGRQGYEDEVEPGEGAAHAMRRPDGQLRD